MTSSKAKMGFESPPNSPGAQQMLAGHGGRRRQPGGAVLCASRMLGPRRGRSGARRGSRQRKKTEWPGLGQRLYLLQWRRRTPDS